MNLYGLIGKKLSHSASKGYFSSKFSSAGLLRHSYELFELEKIEDFLKLIQRHPSLKGLNVTIPYKKAIMPFLDLLSPEAEAIQAVNTISIRSKLTGHNTDCLAFKKTIIEHLGRISAPTALIIGTGGGAAAISYALKQLKFECLYVSRSQKNKPHNIITYEELTPHIFKYYKLIINCTPIGMFPNVSQILNIPYHYLDYTHFCYDLIYNPTTTTFLGKAMKRGAYTFNGFKMLIYQAEEAWKIWNSQA